MTYKLKHTSGLYLAHLPSNDLKDRQKESLSNYLGKEGLVFKEKLNKYNVLACIGINPTVFEWEDVKDC